MLNLLLFSITLMLIGLEITLIKSQPPLIFTSFLVILLNTKYEFFLLQWLLKNLGVSTLSITSLYCNNRSAIQIIHNDIFHEQTKYIKIDYHFFSIIILSIALSSCSLSPLKIDSHIFFTKLYPKQRLHALVVKLKFVSHSTLSLRRVINVNRS